MDFARNEGESERGYYARVNREVKYALDRPRSLALEAYQAGKSTVKQLEEELVSQFSGSSAAPEAPTEAPAEAPETPSEALEAVSDNPDPSV